jgi:urease accessory protein
MCAAISQSEYLAEHLVPDSGPVCWSDGAARIAVAADRGHTSLRDLYQSDPCRVLFPRPASGSPFEGIVVTTSGGIVGGDRIALRIEAGDNSVATFTTQAAEKIYRSAGADSRIAIELTVGMDSLLEWMPQETILFDGARLRRATNIEVAPGSRLLCGELIVFGRRARGETFTRGFLHDSWRIKEGCRLIWADALHLADDIDGIMNRASSFDGAACYATVIYRADDAGVHLDKVREILRDSPDDRCLAAATCLESLLIMRFLGSDAAATRRAVSSFWSGFRVAVLDLPARLPRVWET